MIALRRPHPAAVCLLLAGLALFVGLGIWQYGRAEYKQDLIERWRQAQQTREIPLRSDTLVFSKVSVTGRYRSERYLLDNQIRESRAGAEVFAPLATDVGVLLVALGWLPYEGPSRTPPALPALPEGELRLRGVWAPVPAHGIRLGRGWAQVQDHPKLMPHFEREAIAADAGVELWPGVLRLEADPATPFRRDWQPVEAVPPQRHLAYALQWWTMALAIVVVFLVVHRKPDSRHE